MILIIIGILIVSIITTAAYVAVAKPELIGLKPPSKSGANNILISNKNTTTIGGGGTQSGGTTGGGTQTGGGNTGGTQTGGTTGGGTQTGGTQTGGTQTGGGNTGGGNTGGGIVISDPIDPVDLPIDCELGDYSSWGICSASCGGGEQTRTRAIKNIAQNGGKECGELSEVRECGTAPCKVDAPPINCELSEWGGWSICDKECGTGSQTRNRRILTSAANGGQECGALTDTRECNTNECPVDCELGPWSEWSLCSKTCGGGEQTRTRRVVVPSANGGRDCGELVETIACNTQACNSVILPPVDCGVSDWSAWGACDTECGGGTRTRNRTITRTAANNGKLCPPLTETENCNTQPCPVNCEVSAWSAPSQCSKTCGGGTSTRTRTVIRNSAFGGEPCPELISTAPCNTQPCVIDCAVGMWGDWSDCSKECGDGTSSRSRSVTVPAANGGRVCPPLTETIACNNTPCPVNCEVSGWSGFSTCSEPCGGGTQIRTRTVTKPAAHGGTACPTLAETQVCNTAPCPINCEVSNYTPWSSCSVPCGDGIQTRERFILTTAANGGTACPTVLKETQPCNNGPCPVDCEMGEWSAWSNCNQPCGGGQQTRTRNIIRNSANGGIACGNTTETQACNTAQCPVNCEVSAWTGFSTCSQPCGTGTQTRTRTITKPAANGGTACPTLAETTTCNTMPCPTNCTVGSWSSWSPCSTPCGDGTQTRSRSVIIPAANGGVACPNLTESQPCNNGPCPVNCVTGAWSDWGTCSASCGGGTQTRNLAVITPAANGGTPCPSILTETQPCNNTPCLPAHLTGTFIMQSGASSSLYMGPAGSVTVANDIELDTDCRTEDRCNFRFIPSVFGTPTNPLYFVESPYRPGIYWKIDSTASNERLEFGACNPAVDDKLCQWSVRPSGTSYQFISAARPSLFVKADSSASGSLVRTQSIDTSTLGRWNLRAK